MRQFFFCCLLLLTMGGLILSAPGQAAAKRRHSASPAHERQLLNARSAILLDVASGRILYAQNPDRPNAPASLTKIMTMYVILDQVRNGTIHLNDQVSVKRRHVRIKGSRMGLHRGDKTTLDTLLMGLAVSSGNDASLAAAEHAGKSQQGFVRLMNAKAAELGMSSSRFHNPHGLYSNGHITTARDMAVLARQYLRRHPEALRYHSTRELNYHGCQTHNGNPLLGKYPGVDGLKTGWIGASGFNLIFTGVRGKTRLLGVLLGAPTSEVRARESYRLLEAGFRSLNSSRKVGDILPQVRGSAFPLTAASSGKGKIRRRATQHHASSTCLAMQPHNDASPSTTAAPAAAAPAAQEQNATANNPL